MGSKQIIELFQSSFESSGENTDYFSQYLGSCIEHGAFYCKDNTEIVVKSINTSLNSLFDREKGLMLLMAFLPQASTEAFSDNAVSWMIHCNKFTLQKDGIISTLAFKILTSLIKMSPKFPEVSKDTAKQIVPKFLQDHVRRRSGSKVPLELLECLQACMLEYRGPAGEFRLDILKLLLSTFESRAEVVEVTARCVALVAGVGGAGKEGVSHKTAWQRQKLALVALLHNLLNTFYEHIDCVQQMKYSTSLINLELTVESVTEKNQLIKIQRQATQFNSAAQCLQAMLLDPFPVAKSVAPDAILDLVSHVQIPTQHVLGSTREALAILSVLPSVQAAGLRLLEALVLCVGRNLVPQGDIVCQLCCQIIVWSHKQHPDWPYAMNKPFSVTRLAAYSCLNSWLSVAGRNSQIESIADKIIPVILADIHSQKPSIKLIEGYKPGKGKRKQQTLLNVEDRSERLADRAANHRLCERGLVTLTQLLQTASYSVKQDTYQKILSTVLALTEDLPVPYSEAGCRVTLYNLLLTLCLNPHPSVEPPLGHALHIFRSHQHNANPLIRSTCAAALSCLDTVIHPTAPTVYLSTRRNTIQLEAEDNGVKSSEAEDYESESEESAPKKRKIEEDLGVNNKSCEPSMDVVSVDDNYELVLEGPEEDREDCEIIEDCKEPIDTVECERNVKHTTDNEDPQEVPYETEESCVEVEMKNEATLRIETQPIANDEETELPCETEESCVEKNEVTQRIETDSVLNKNITNIINVDSEKSKDIEFINLEDGPKEVAEQCEPVDDDVAVMLLDFHDVVNSDYNKFDN